MVGSASPKKGARNSFSVRPVNAWNKPLRRVELEQGLGPAGRRKVRVGIGVAADLMTLADHPLEKAALGQRILADDEEGRGNVLRLEDVENPRSPVRIGAVVEGQRDEPRAVSRRA